MRSRSAIEFQDIVAATFVVGSDLQIADFTSLEAAISNLPIEGGNIFCLGGTFDVPSTITLPDKAVVIRGSGIGATTLSMPTFAGPMFEVADGLTASRRYEISDLSAVGGEVVGQEFWRFDDANGYGNCRACSISISGLETIVNWSKYDTNYLRQSNFWIDYSIVSPFTDGTSIIVKSANPAGSFMGPIALRSCDTFWSKSQEINPQEYSWSCDADVDLWFNQPQFIVWRGGTAFNGLNWSGGLLEMLNGDVTVNGNGWDAWDFMEGGSYITTWQAAPPAFAGGTTDGRLIFESYINLIGVISFNGAAIKCTSGGNIESFRVTGTTFGANPIIELTSTSRGTQLNAILEGGNGTGTFILLANANYVSVKAIIRNPSANTKTIEETGSANNNIGVGCIGLNTGLGMTIIGATSKFVVGDYNLG